MPWLANSNLPGLVLDGAGEGAALEAEQLRLEQLGRQRRAVDLDERAARAAATRRGCARATSSLPVPLSPRISTVTSVSATRSISSRTSRICSLVPSSSPRTAHAATAARQVSSERRRGQLSRPRVAQTAAE